MPIPVRCPDCGVRSQFPDRYAGNIVACKSCGTDIEVPSGKSGQSGAKGTGKRKKSKSSAGGGGVIAAAVAGVALLSVLVGVAIFFLSQPSADPAVSGAPPETKNQVVVQQPTTLAAATPSATTSPTAASTTPPAGGFANPTPAAASSGTPSGFGGGGLVPERLKFKKSTAWNLKADPPGENAPLTSEKPIKFKWIGERLPESSLVFPVTQSLFAAVRPEDEFKSSIEVLNLSTGMRVGQIPMQGLSLITALSPDGRYLAIAKSGSQSITVHDLQAKKSLGELTTGAQNGQFRLSGLAMPRPDRLVALSQLERGVKVWSLPDGQFLKQISPGDKCRPETFSAYSPGGKYLALVSHFLEKTVEVYELETGTLAATIAIEGQTALLDLTGFCFSKDGTELALLYDINAGTKRPPYSQFVVWNLDRGEIVTDFDLEPRLGEQLEPEYGKLNLEAFPSGRRWLVHNLGILDRDQKKIILRYPKLKHVEAVVQRHVMGDSWLVGVVGEKGDSRLESITLSDTELAAAAQLADAGGLPMDATLPPLTAADFRDASTAIAATTWTVPVDPGSATDGWKESVPLETGSGIIRDLVIARAADPVAVVRIAQDEAVRDPEIQAYEMQTPEVRRTLHERPPRPVAAKSFVAGVQLPSGKSVGRFELPFSGDVLSVSPDGQQVLVALHRGEGRLDLFALKDQVTPVQAWRPYRTASEKREREIYSAEFIDNDHVATLNPEGSLVVWKLQPLSPLFVVPEVKQFALSPGGQVIAAIRGNSLGDKDVAFFNAHDGNGLGKMELESRIESLAFHPNGKWLALSHGDSANHLLTILDLADGQVASRFAVPNTADKLQWVGDDFLLLGGQQLVSREFQAVVWNYEAGRAVLAAQPVNTRCCFALPVGKNWQFRSVVLPQGDVAAKLDATQLAKLAVVKPGDAAVLQVQVGDAAELAELKAIAADELKKRVEVSQLTVQESPTPLTIRVDLTLVTNGTATLSKIGERTVTETINRKAIQVKVSYQQQGKELWKTERSVNNLERILLRLNPGETAQAGADRTMLDGAKLLLAGLQLPSYVFGDQARAGLGTSTLASVR